MEKYSSVSEEEIGNWGLLIVFKFPNSKLSSEFIAKMKSDFSVEYAHARGKHSEVKFSSPGARDTGIALAQKMSVDDIGEGKEQSER